jgi:hypothetical protein
MGRFDLALNPLRQLRSLVGSGESGIHEAHNPVIRLRQPECANFPMSRKHVTIPKISTEQ